MASLESLYAVVGTNDKAGSQGLESFKKESYIKSHLPPLNLTPVN